MFSSRSAAPQVSANKPDGASFPVHYASLPVEARRNLVAIYAGNVAKGNATEAAVALKTLKVILFQPDRDPLVRWNIAQAAIETAHAFPELRRAAHHMLDMITRNPVADEEPDLSYLIDKIRKTAPVPPAFKAL
jgi:hypothetical protein